MSDGQRAMLDRLGITYDAHTTAGEAWQAIALRQAGMQESVLARFLAPADETRKGHGVLTPAPEGSA